jgi:hypothetical protein
MILNRSLVDKIKHSFCRKSSAQLQEIVDANDLELWSAEAVTAADELLGDRRVGCAPEPDEPEAERAPPPLSYDSAKLALRALGALGAFGVLGPVLGSHVAGAICQIDYGDRPDPDFPVPFGSNQSWIAIDSNDTEGVTAALGLVGGAPATWKTGLAPSHHMSVFVSPPVADWILAVGPAFFPRDQVDAFVKHLLEKLSRQFGEAQYFCSHREVDLHVWARARKGRLERGFAWFGEQGRPIWDEGAQTKEERALFGPQPPSAQHDENSVFQLANLWSVDPTTLDVTFKEPGIGILGELANTNGHC